MQDNIIEETWYRAEKNMDKKKGIILYEGAQ